VYEPCDVSRRARVVSGPFRSTFRHGATPQSLACKAAAALQKNGIPLCTYYSWYIHLLSSPVGRTIQHRPPSSADVELSLPHVQAPDSTHSSTGHTSGQTGPAHTSLEPNNLDVINQEQHVAEVLPLWDPSHNVDTSCRRTD
jgi:hypothetical protein